MEKAIEETNLYENQILIENNNVKRNVINMGAFAIGTIYALININNSESSTDTALNAAMLLSFGIGYLSSSIDAMKAIARKEIVESELNKKITNETKKLILKNK